MIRAVAIALFLTLGTAAPANALSSEQRVEAFRAVCMEATASLQQLTDRAETSGWTQTDDSAHPQLPVALQLSTSLARVAQPSYFRSDVDGQSIFMIVGTTEGSPTGAIACYVFDFDATDSGDQTALTRVFALSPARTEAHEGVLYMARWHQPGLPERVTALGTAFIQAGGPASAELGMTGSMIALMAVPAQ